ncbi:mitochondrial carrier [Aaosphaeria arxii CBS 175.79]|uniref:Mitochondrial carrier n=1 Tax=Aaosphaeria arxii CBS 175.79 TaxID=1450172 RepID=A0A6A5XF91_9PLEO|nr:mitochondrial carrier [Aaosphaeria arxii CBS 175.79]KAF2011516.1 mitochondrial carrier [Aaosphaeria arxii CBS 175.79]
MSPTRKNDVTPLQSVLAGAAAGGFESMVTYPTEYVKTRQQLLRGPTNARSPLQILISTIRNDGIGRLYTGGAAFCVSNASKSGIRFLTFDFARGYMPKGVKGKTTVSGSLAAGMCAGIAESVLVLTPGENLKTRLIDDRAGKQLYRSSGHAIKSIMAAEGPLSFFRGVCPVTLKQSSNAMVRFTSYDFLSSTLRPILGSSTSVAAGAMAGIITVYCTMPFDNVKTQLQGLEGQKMYNGSWDCAKQLVQDGGFRLLWKGTTPRLVRLSVSGAISFTVYEKVVQLTQTLGGLSAESRKESVAL